MASPGPVFLDSITDADATHAGRVVASGSHGGLYPASIASNAALRAVVFNDAGVGLEGAGVAGVLRLDAVGMAAAAVDAATAEIGSAAETAANGVVSTANEAARRLGVIEGMAAPEALKRLREAPAPTAQLPRAEEARREVALGRRRVLLVDSASLIGADDAGRVVVAGSHGGLIGGDPARALKTEADIAVFNDAGVGKNRIGVRRLDALEARGVAAATVSHASARIGDAASALATGVLSHVNAIAAARGAAPGLRLADWLADL